MDFDFDWQEPSWKRMLDHLAPGSTLTVERFFALLGAVDEDEAQEAAEALEGRHISLDVSGVPVPAAGEAAERLHLEARLVSEGRMPGGLEPGDPLRRYWRELKELPRLDEAALAAGLRAGKSPNALLEGLLWLVTELAPEFAGQGVLMQDLMQEGAMGLMRALELPGEDPMASARWYCRETMARAVALQFLTSGEADRLLASMRAYQQADRRLLRELGRNPGPEELAQELGKTLAEVESIRRMVEAAVTQPKKNETPAPEPEEQEAVEDSAYFRLRTRVEELLSMLEPLDRQILTLRFGLEGSRPQTREETAESLGIPPEEVAEREAAAMQKLRM